MIDKVTSFMRYSQALFGKVVQFFTCNQPVRKAVSYRGLFTAGWFGVREKHCFRLEIYDRLRASEQAAYHFTCNWLCTRIQWYIVSVVSFLFG